MWNKKSDRKGIQFEKKQIYKITRNWPNLSINLDFTKSKNNEFGKITERSKWKFDNTWANP